MEEPIVEPRENYDGGNGTKLPESCLGQPGVGTKVEEKAASPETESSVSRSLTQITEEQDLARQNLNEISNRYSAPGGNGAVKITYEQKRIYLESGLNQEKLGRLNPAVRQAVVRLYNLYTSPEKRLGNVLGSVKQGLVQLSVKEREKMIELYGQNYDCLGLNPDRIKIGGLVGRYEELDSQKEQVAADLKQADDEIKEMSARKEELERRKQTLTDVKERRQVAYEVSKIKIDLRSSSLLEATLAGKLKGVLKMLESTERRIEEKENELMELQNDTVAATLAAYELESKRESQASAETEDHLRGNLESSIRRAETMVNDRAHFEGITAQLSPKARGYNYDVDLYENPQRKRGRAETEKKSHQTIDEMVKVAEKIVKG